MSHWLLGDPADEPLPDWIEDYPICDECGNADIHEWPCTPFAEYGIAECVCGGEEE